ncbi:hypothetical protein [Streptomyces sp. URMC 124]|uniref:hypothetical protein n=1 Tax=Streptomyces sp. URMC 124 TaxID=3423405 RepID=UPI003F1DD6B0
MLRSTVKINTEDEMPQGARIIAAIETAWDVLREQHPELPVVYVTVDVAGARHNLAYPVGLEADMKPELPIHKDTLAAGSRAILESLLHVATHALCHARGISETANRGRRHNRRFADVAEELGMAWPEGEPPHTSRGFSPVPITPEAVEKYAPLMEALDKTLKGVDLNALQAPPKAGSGSRLTLQCGCVPARTFQIGRRVAAVGPIMCGVCGKEFTEK